VNNLAPVYAESGLTVKKSGPAGKHGVHDNPAGSAAGWSGGRGRMACTRASGRPWGTGGSRPAGHQGFIRDNGWTGFEPSRRKIEPVRGFRPAMERTKNRDRGISIRRKFEPVYQNVAVQQCTVLEPCAVQFGNQGEQGGTKSGYGAGRVFAQPGGEIARVRAPQATGQQLKLAGRHGLSRRPRTGGGCTLYRAIP
jgi:hypothetical protein